MRKKDRTKHKIFGPEKSLRFLRIDHNYIKVWCREDGMTYAGLARILMSKAVKCEQKRRLKKGKH